MSNIAVLYLVRNNPVESLGLLQRFLVSYKQFPSGLEHDLIIIFKGFEDDQDLLQKHVEYLQNFRYQSILIDDFGFDHRTYFSAIKQYKTKYYCLLNSFTRILDSDWLFKLYSNLTKSGVGIVGVTGSYESQYTNIIGEPDVTPEKLEKHKKYFNPYPSYHIRSTGYMISADTINNLKLPRFVTKMDSYRFESGKDSLTNQIFRMGLDALVVDKNGVGYQKENWAESETFRYRWQDNLLIADKHTQIYQNMDLTEKKRIAFHTWRKEF